MSLYFVLILWPSLIFHGTFFVVFHDANNIWSFSQFFFYKKFYICSLSHCLFDFVCIISSSNILIGFKTGGLYLFLGVKNISKAKTYTWVQSMVQMSRSKQQCQNILLWKLEVKVIQDLEEWRIQFRLKKVGIQLRSALNKDLGWKWLPSLAMSSLQPLSHGVFITAPAGRNYPHFTDWETKAQSILPRIIQLINGRARIWTL